MVIGCLAGIVMLGAISAPGARSTAATVPSDVIRSDVQWGDFDVEPLPRGRAEPLRTRPAHVGCAEERQEGTVLLDEESRSEQIGCAQGAPARQGVEEEPEDQDPARREDRERGTSTAA